MRLNSVGVVDFRDANKNNWLYLRLGSTSAGFPTAFGTWGGTNTVYDGSDVTNAVGTIGYNSLSTDSDSFSVEFILTSVDLVGNTIDKLYLSGASSGTEVVSADDISEFTTTDYYNYKITYKVEIIR